MSFGIRMATSTLLMACVTGIVAIGCGSDDGNETSGGGRADVSGGATTSGGGSDDGTMTGGSGGADGSTTASGNGGADGSGGSDGSGGFDGSTTASGNGGFDGGGGSDGSGGFDGTGGGGDGAGGGSGTPDFRLYGYGSGTTGGKGGAVVSVSTLRELHAAAGREEPLIIQITGKISGSEKVHVASNKTIVGVGTRGELDGVELTLRNSSNIIIRNLKIHHVEAGDGDAIHLEGTRHVWIDHCELWSDSPAEQPDKDKYDGLIDITRDSSDITISWNYLHDHWKGMLIGASDSDISDRRVTFHHNYIKNVQSRLPSYRGGQGHVYNSYFEDVLTSGVNSRVDACLRVEANHFYRVRHPITTLDSPAGGTDRRNNKFQVTVGDQASGKDCIWEAPYSYPLDDVEDVKAIVTEYAGVGKTDPLKNLP